MNPDTLDAEIAHDLRNFAIGHPIQGEPPREPGWPVAWDAPELSRPSPLARLTGERNPMVACYLLAVLMLAVAVLIARVW